MTNLSPITVYHKFVSTNPKELGQSSILSALEIILKDSSPPSGPRTYSVHDSYKKGECLYHPELQIYGKIKEVPNPRRIIVDWFFVEDLKSSIKRETMVQNNPR